MQEKTKLKIMKVRRYRKRVKVKFLMLAGLTIGGNLMPLMASRAEAESCPDLKIVFARGSGGERWTDQNYLEFKTEVENKIPSGISYEFLDLDYPAVGVGADNLSVTLGAFFGAGDAYEFGDSVNAGVKELGKIVNNGCTKTKYVLGGYSQGAMVVSKALGSLNADKIIYAATFGDPKIYLPEGAGLVPAACHGENLSEYRAYVPDCRAYEGLLGSYRPYQPEAYSGKLGTWCNKYDIFCSSYFSISSHTSYVSDNLYEDASRVIANKIAAAFRVKNSYISPHDTAILIDSTGSMGWMIDQFKNEAMRLANETFGAGGRVALYDYRDLDDPYEPVARCTFESCTPENFEEHLNSIIIDGGGDEPESLLSASVKVMNELKWRKGATKSLVVLTDAPFLTPDRDGTTTLDVVKLSKSIDPVNMYIITDENVLATYPEVEELTNATGGRVVTDLGSLNLLTDEIMERYDTLPRVEEDASEVNDEELPRLTLADIVDEGKRITVKFENTGTRTIIILNDAVLGESTENFVTIDGLFRDKMNELTLVPVNDSRRGERVVVEIPKKEPGSVMSEKEQGLVMPKEELDLIVPKTPDTGIAR